MSFEEQFTNSIEFRTHFDPHFVIEKNACDLLEATFRNTSEKAMQEPFFSIRQQVCSLAKTYDQQNSSASYSYQCLADSHVFLRACIEQKVVNEKYMTLTVGDVSYRGKRLFGTSRTTLQSTIASGICTQEKPLFHVWLTLADMTVIDFSILKHVCEYNIKETMPDTEQRVTIWRPERKGDFDYHPVLVDDDFLSRLRRPIQ